VNLIFGFVEKSERHTHEWTPRFGRENIAPTKRECAYCGTIVSIMDWIVATTDVPGDYANLAELANVPVTASEKEEVMNDE